MKLFNRSLLYLSASLLGIVAVWSIVFYFNILAEIKKSVDEGIENYKRQIISRVQEDSDPVVKGSFDESFFTIREIDQQYASAIGDVYSDTLLFMQDADDEEPEPEPVRMLTSAFEKEGRFYELKVINSMIEEDDLMAELLRDAIWLYSALVLCLIILNSLVLQRLWSPFYQLLERLKEYRIGKREHFPQVATRTTEFNDLQQAVHLLLLRSEDTFDQQNQFIGNASHELQTPLALAINKLELFVENGNLTPSQAESIAEILGTMSRLVKLNKSLLLLTRIENRQISESQQVSLQETVAECMNELAEIAEFKDIEVSCVYHENLVVGMEPSLANSVVSNLLRNAINHTQRGGKVWVEILKDALIISNTAAGESLNSEKVFNRFYKSGQSGNTGLGLAIVEAICRLYGYEISYHFEQNYHKFELTVK